MSEESTPTLINRVAQSKLVTLDLEKYYPEIEIHHFDLKDFLFQGFVLKEKEFRQSLKEHDWQQYKGGLLLIFCSTDAIIPRWAYMLVTGYASGIAKEIFSGTMQNYLQVHYQKVIAGMDAGEFEGKPVIIKGCSDREVPASAYVDITLRLAPVAASIMYGEPCSTVPVFKKPKI